MENLIYLVVIPKGALYYCSKKIQSYLWEKYDLKLSGLPEIHITMDAFYYESQEQVQQIKDYLKDILKETPPFEIISNGFSYIPCPYNCITIHIVKTKELKNIYEYIHEGMIQRGIRVREFTANEIVFHISIAGIHGRSWSEKESQQAWNELRDFKIQVNSLVEEFELWYPTMEPEDRLISKISLKEMSK